MIEKMPVPDEAHIVLSPDAALVLFELLSRWCSSGDSPTPDAVHFESPAECAVLHGLLADLETQLATPFEADYTERVSQARNRLQYGWDGATLRE